MRTKSFLVAPGDDRTEVHAMITRIAIIVLALASAVLGGNRGHGFDSWRASVCDAVLQPMPQHQRSGRESRTRPRKPS